jgi:hypothetical protein
MQGTKLTGETKIKTCKNISLIFPLGFTKNIYNVKTCLYFLIGFTRLLTRHVRKKQDVMFLLFYYDNGLLIKFV